MLACIITPSQGVWGHALQKIFGKWPFLRRILAGFQVLMQHEIPFIYLQNKCQKVINAT